MPMSVRKEYYELAKKLGCSGDEPRTIAGAIDALADTLAGEDVNSGRTIAEAVRALAPYVGGSGEMPANYAVLDDSFSGRTITTMNGTIFDKYATEACLNVYSAQYGGIFADAYALKKAILPSAVSIGNGGVFISNDKTGEVPPPPFTDVFLPKIVSMYKASIIPNRAVHVYLGPNLATIDSEALSNGDPNVWSNSIFYCAFSEADAPAGVKDALVATGATINYDVPVSEWPM